MRRSAFHAPRTRGLGTMLFLARTGFTLGLSCMATSLALEAQDCYLAKSAVYETVQEAAEKVPGLTA